MAANRYQVSLTGTGDQTGWSRTFPVRVVPRRVCALAVALVTGSAFAELPVATDPSALSASQIPAVSATTIETGNDRPLFEEPQSTTYHDTPDLGSLISPQEHLFQRKATTPLGSQEPVFNDIWSRLRHGFGLGNLNEIEQSVQKFERWYSQHPADFERITRHAYWFLPYVLGEVEKRGMPSEVAILPIIESAFRPDATSRSQAAGMWQFMRSTGTRFGLRQDAWVDERRDLVRSTQAALDYLGYLSKTFDGNWELTFAAYNAGEGAVRNAMRINRKRNLPTSYSFLPLSRETREYVPKLLAVRNILQTPAKYDIRLSPIPNRQTLSIINAESQVDLFVFASLSPIFEKDLHLLNMGYTKGITPPDGPHQLVVPLELADQLLTKLNQMTLEERLKWNRHQVRAGDSLDKIARQYSVTIKAIMSANQLSSSLIHPGKMLKIPLSTGRHHYREMTFVDITPQDGDTLYVVKPGDSLWSIAQFSGVSLSEMLQWNGISKNTPLYPGQELIILR